MKCEKIVNISQEKRKRLGRPDRLKTRPDVAAFATEGIDL